MARDGGWWEQHGPRLPADGIKARTRRGSFGRSWWAGRWIAALERLVDAGRLARGRSYARTGQVLALEVGADGATARVQGSRPEPYDVDIRFRRLSAEEWERVVRAMAGRAIYAARLLSGEMPEDVEQVFAATGCSLLPAEGRDMQTRCSCPDPANPCKHIAAVHYLLGERFDEDPFLMFLLRGRSREEIVTALRAHRAGAAADDAPTGGATEPVATDDGDATWFWTAPSPNAEIALKFALPETDALPVKALGRPPFVRDQEAFTAALEATYRAISQYALRLALDDDAAADTRE
jgi:uncharacterized Zn finger protein